MWLAKRFNKGDIESNEFTYKDLGVMAYIGNKKAIANISGSDISGWVAWLIWRGAYLTKTVSWRNKVLIPVYWALNCESPIERIHPAMAQLRRVATTGVCASPLCREPSNANSVHFDMQGSLAETFQGSSQIRSMADSSSRYIAIEQLLQTAVNYNLLLLLSPRYPC